MEEFCCVNNGKLSSHVTEVVASMEVVQNQFHGVEGTSTNASEEPGCDNISSSKQSEVESESFTLHQEADVRSPISCLNNETPEISTSECIIIESASPDDLTTDKNSVDHIIIDNEDEVTKIHMPDAPAQSEASVFSMVQVVESVDKESGQGSESASDSEDSSDSDSCSSSSDETSSSDDDSCDLTIRHKDVELAEEIATLKNSDPPKVKGEILSNELPTVDDLNILLPEDTILEVIGKVAHIMSDHSVIIQSYLNKPALDYETVLFFSRDTAIGKVEETFGPVPSPFYVVRFNDEEHLSTKGVELNKEVSYAPHIQDFTSFVFVSTLRSIRGSDASWCNDQEPPPSCLDYSDDEQEREARRRKKNVGAESENKHKKPIPRNGQETQDATRGNRRPRGRGRDRWHNESTRFNVTNVPDPSQMGWQSAVNEMARQGSDRTRFCPAPPQPYDLFNCFLRPPQDPPECLGSSNVRHQSHVRPRPLEGYPPCDWRPAQPPYMLPSMFGFPPPPPPPPPPP